MLMRRVNADAAGASGHPQHAAVVHLIEQARRSIR